MLLILIFRIHLWHIDSNWQFLNWKVTNASYFVMNIRIFWTMHVVFDQIFNKDYS